MKLDIIPIGNSKGIRLPKSLLEQCGFRESVEVKVEANRLIVSPTVHVRSGWDEAFKQMANNADDELIQTPPTSFEANEWHW